MDELDYAVYDDVVEAVEYLGGDFYDTEDLKDAIVDLYKDRAHFSDTDLNELVTYIYAIDQAILHGS